MSKLPTALRSGVTARLSAFVLERFPFALPLVQDVVAQAGIPENAQDAEVIAAVTVTPVEPEQPTPARQLDKPHVDLGGRRW